MASGITAVTFDAGSTLLFPHPSVGAVYSEIMAGHGLELRPALLETTFRDVWRQAVAGPRTVINPDADKQWWYDVVARVLQRLNTSVPGYDALFEDLWAAFAQPSRWRLHDQATTVLAELCARGYRLAVLSNWDDRLPNLIEALGLSRYFEALFVSCEVGAEKPDIRIFRHAQECFGLPAAQILHVGDSPVHDAEGACNAGWQYVLLGTTHGDQENGRVIACLSELLPLLP